MLWRLCIIKTKTAFISRLFLNCSETLKFWDKRKAGSLPKKTGSFADELMGKL